MRKTKSPRLSENPMNVDSEDGITDIKRTPSDVRYWSKDRTWLERERMSLSDCASWSRTRDCASANSMTEDHSALTVIFFSAL